MNKIFVNIGGDPVTYIDMSKVNSRKAANRVILLIIDTMISEYSDWRFNQLLFNFGIEKFAEGHEQDEVLVWADLFSEESKTTLSRLLEISEVQKFYKKYKKEKAEVINFNEYKGSHKK